MKSATYSIALIAVVSLVISLSYGMGAERTKAKSEDYRGLWLNYHQKFLDNQENEEIRENAIHYNNLSVEYTDRSLQLDAITRSWQTSFQASFLCLMFILVEFTHLGKREWKEWTRWAKGATLLTLIVTGIIFSFAFYLSVIFELTY